VSDDGLLSDTVYPSGIVISAFSAVVPVIVYFSFTWGGVSTCPHETILIAVITAVSNITAVVFAMFVSFRCFDLVYAVLTLLRRWWYKASELTQKPFCARHSGQKWYFLRTEAAVYVA
jgi:predicted neutral ceramidase superfamily lipid hydrolase